MSAARSGGMTAIGILAILAALGAGIRGVLTILQGGALAVLGNAAGGQAASDAATFGTLYAVFGATGIVAGLVLLAGGIGVLKVAPWGRYLMLGAAGLGVFNNVGRLFVLEEITLAGFMGLAFSIVVIVLFMMPDWKDAFSRRAVIDVSSAPLAVERRKNPQPNPNVAQNATPAESARIPGFAMMPVKEPPKNSAPDDGRSAA